MGETELIGALKAGGPWAIAFGAVIIMWRRDVKEMFAQLLKVVESNTAINTQLVERLDRVLEDRR